MSAPRWLKGLLAAALGAPACATAPVPEPHARAVEAHLANLAQQAHQIATDAFQHRRCTEGEASVAERAVHLDDDLDALASRAEGGWATKEAFEVALGEATTLQTELAILQAEYDRCRALSGPAAVPGDLPPGARRLVILGVQDPGEVLPPEARRDLDDYLVARLGARFAVVPKEAVEAATRAHRGAAGCDAACARAVAQDVRGHKILTVALERDEDRCTVILALDDLATGVTERARTVRSDCALETVLAGIEDAVAPLAR